MITNLRALTGIGSTLLLIGGLLAAGCGQGPVAQPGITKRTQASRPAHPQSMFAARGASSQGPVSTFDDDGGEAPAADPGAGSGGGGLAPIARPTAVPAVKDPSGGGGTPTEVDELYAELRAYGFTDTKKSMVQRIQAVTHKYPTGWDSHIDTQKHWGWWAETIPPEFRKDHQTYVDDALRLAQYRFDVVYYIWVSKHRPSDRKPGMAPPPINFNEKISIVKGIRGDDGWIVEISPRGTVVDFLQVPREYLSDYNHFIPVPTQLY